jgi:hypothetical protein
MGFRRKHRRGQDGPGQAADRVTDCRRRARGGGPMTLRLAGRMMLAKTSGTAKRWSRGDLRTAIDAMLERHLALDHLSHS